MRSGFISYSVNVHNFIQISLWSNILLKILSLLFDNINYNNKIDNIIMYLKIVQTLQILDIILNMLKLTSGNLFGSIAQVFGRLFITWYIVNISVPLHIIFILLLPWSISDIIRYTFYMIPNSITGILR